MRVHILSTIFFFILILFLGIRPIPVPADIYSFVDREGIIHFTNVPKDSRYKLFLRTRKSLRQGPGAVNTRRYDPVIRAACQRFGVDRNLVKAVIKVESGFDYRAISPKGAQGLMQLMPQTAHEMCVLNPFDPVENIYGGVKYLKQLLSQFDGNVALALAAYNAGPQKVVDQSQIPRIKQTQGYVQRVLRYLQDYKKKGSYQGDNVL